VVEGRDIGTVVFPSSQVKIFLIAGLQVRNHRRVRQRKGMGMRSEEREVRDNLKMRDTIDSTREVAPLSQAPGALILDTTHSTPEETLKEVFALIDERLQAERSIECRTS
jgi:cytidylate kinase